MIGYHPQQPWFRQHRDVSTPLSLGLGRMAVTEMMAVSRKSRISSVFRIWNFIYTITYISYASSFIHNQYSCPWQSHCYPACLNNVRCWLYGVIHTHTDKKNVRLVVRLEFKEVKRRLLDLSLQFQPDGDHQFCPWVELASYPIVVCQPLCENTNTIQICSWNCGHFQWNQCQIISPDPR